MIKILPYKGDLFMLTDHPLYYLSVNAAHNDDYHSRMTEAMNTTPVSAENGQ